MKKTLLAVSFALICVISYGQQLRKEVKSYQAVDKIAIASATEKPSTIIEDIYKPEYNGKNRFISIIDLGTSANAYSYGYAGGQKSILSYNAEINTVSHFHRMGGELDPGGYSGDLGYDYSTDGGQTFTNMVECYVCTENAGGEYYTDAARYPNHGIYNPADNTDPANAYLTFFAPTLDGSNSADSWGGYGYGISQFGADPAYDTKNLVSSDPGEDIFRYIPDGYCVTNTGDIWVSDIDQDWSSGSLVYTGYLLISHGVWNADIMDFEFEDILIDCPVEEGISRPSMSKIEFAPDGMTGYLAILGDDGELDFSLGAIFPILWKTVDGGETWGDPIDVQLGGFEGIEAIKYYMSDTDWTSFWAEPYPERDDVKYTTAFDFDLTVDADGNPHIGVGVGVASLDTDYSIYSSHPYYAMTDIWSPDGGITWDAYIIDKPKQFRSSEFDTDYTEDNRVQIARNHEGTHIFVSYMDTHLDGDYNDFPDIMARGIRLSDGEMTMVDSAGIILDQATNVTNLSEAMWQSYFMIMANEVPETIIDHQDIFTIPFSYQEMNGTNIGDPVQYKYIQDFKFIYYLDGNNEIETTNSFNVSQNYPNPFSGEAEIAVSINSTSTLSIDVYNLMGQKTYSIDAGEVNAGTHTYTIDAANLQPGVYFYSVTAGTKTISKKMIVE